MIILYDYILIIYYITKNCYKCIYMEIMTIGRTIGHTARCSHKFHIKCNQKFVSHT